LPRAVVYMTESYSMMNQPHTTVQLWITTPPSTLP
jgi:hypothetical protein